MMGLYMPGISARLDIAPRAHRACRGGQELFQRGRAGKAFQA
jgi:hypothetical protein